MANKSTTIRITHAKNDATPWRISLPAGEARNECINLAALLERVGGGMEAATVEVGVSGTALVKASGTATFSGVVATDHLDINGVAITCVANGAVANQFNVGASDTESATNCAAAINASVTAKVKGCVRASASGAVVTITAYQAGLLGNLVTLAQTGGHITLSAAALAGGAGDDVLSTTYTRS